VRIHPGFVLVKKVPGTLHFTARAEGHSFDNTWMNMTHAVHSMYFGTRPSPRKYYELKRLHPLGLDPSWMDKMVGTSFYSDHVQHTHEHYLQVRGGVGGRGGREVGWGGGDMRGSGRERGRAGGWGGVRGCGWESGWPQYPRALPAGAWDRGTEGWGSLETNCCDCCC
jgi:hypothetical protein